MIEYEKVYVALTALFNEDGIVKPREIFWDGGRRFKIDKVVSERMCPPDHVGALLTIRYDVLIGGAEKTVYFETRTNRWFVEKPVLREN